ncbi:MAG: hypothetical protein SFV81_26790 [Pirellulaceae bacterium]|nr:hypothetical protein [Pirellulaceae bacterium]
MASDKAILKKSPMRDLQQIDEHYARMRERSEREDVMMFLNACFASTNQAEFYVDQFTQAVSIHFLHRYVLANYRTLYARTLACDVNHANQQAIILNLLAAGAPQRSVDRAEEGELIATTLQRLPANRAYQLLTRLSQLKINNRRSRAVVKRFLASRRDLVFDAVKYRRSFRNAAIHSHLKLAEEFGQFFFDLKGPRAFTTPLFERFRAAHYSAAALYELPYSVAESLAVRHQVPRAEFLKRIAPQMTANEKLRLRTSADRDGVTLGFDLAHAPLTRLALYVLSLSQTDRRERQVELDQALKQAAARAVKRNSARQNLGKVAAVLDRSYSATGSRQKRNRPLAVALAADYLLHELSTEYLQIWTPALPAEGTSLGVFAEGQTSLATNVLEAIDWQPDWIVIVSDGFENDPPGMADQIAQAYQQLGNQVKPVQWVHCNPVFDSEHFAPRRLGSTIPTVGLRDAEDLIVMIQFVNFVTGAASLGQLEQRLADVAAAYIHGTEPEAKTF